MMDQRYDLLQVEQEPARGGVPELKRAIGAAHSEKRTRW